MAIAGDPARWSSPTNPPPRWTSPSRPRSSSCLRDLRDETGCSFLLVTHDLGVAAQIADRIAVLYGGRFAEVGPTATMLREPAHPYTVGLLRSRLSLTHRPDPSGADFGRRAAGPDQPAAGCAFAPRCALVMDECATTLPDTTAMAKAQDAFHVHARACFAPLPRSLSWPLSRCRPRRRCSACARDAPGGDPRRSGAEAELDRRLGSPPHRRRQDVQSRLVERGKVQLQALRGIDLR